MKPIIPSINYHLTKACNMRCKFCFATFNDLGTVKHDLAKAKRIIDEVAKAGFEKITFAGGEPTIVKELPEILAHAKRHGLITTIVTNGAKLAEKELLDQLSDNLDWVALSIDSVDDSINLESGRAINGKTAITKEYFIELIKELKKREIRVKVNTVVSLYNWNSDINDFIQRANPDRWKILQALKINGQNDAFQDQFSITEKELNHFLTTHEKTLKKFKNAIEPVNLIKGSYLMISPEGKLFDSTEDRHTYSDEIMKVGLESALEQIKFDKSKFIQRNGYYDWSNQAKLKTSNNVI